MTASWLAQIREPKLVRNKTLLTEPQNSDNILEVKCLSNSAAVNRILTIGVIVIMLDMLTDVFSSYILPSSKCINSSLEQLSQSPCGYFGRSK